VGKKLKPQRYAVDDVTGCWNWLLFKNPKGYGLDSRNGTQQYAHIVAYENVHGPVPEGLEVDHLCRNTSCVNPAHLEAVTHAVNIRRGKNAKLTQEQVDEIRRRYQAGGVSQKKLADEFGVKEKAMRYALQGRTWAAPGNNQAKQIGWESRRGIASRKLSDEQVADIRHKHQTENHSLAELGRQFGVSSTHIGRIVRFTLR
jgi:transposase